MALAQDGRLLVEADEILASESYALRVESPPEVAGLVPAGGTLPAPPCPWTETTPSATVPNAAPANSKSFFISFRI